MKLTLQTIAIFGVMMLVLCALHFDDPCTYNADDYVDCRAAVEGY